MDVRQKPKMDKPKVKDITGNLPKDARRMLTNEYREAAGERDVKRRPEQDGVRKAEDGMRSVGREGIAAGKRGAKSLKNSVRQEFGKVGARPEKAGRRSAHAASPANDRDGRTPATGNRPGGQTAQTRQQRYAGQQRARREAVRGRVVEQNAVRNAAGRNTAGRSSNAAGRTADASYVPAGSSAGRGASAPAGTHVTRGVDSKGAKHGFKTKESRMNRKGGKSTKQGFRVATRNNSAAKKAGKAAKNRKKMKQRMQAVKQASQKMAKASLKLMKKVAMIIAKAAAALGKALVAALGPVGAIILIFVIIAAIAAVVASPFGVFFSGEDPDSKNTMQQTIGSISYEYRENIHNIIGENSHDEMRMTFTNHGYNRADNWIDVLAVYAVKTADFDNGMDVVTLDDMRIEKLRTVFWDMQEVSYERKNERKYNAEDDVYEDYYVLYITAECTGAWTMADRYGFSREQREVLEEMLSGEYDGYFNEMIGSAGLFLAIGDGSGVVGNGNFIWPSPASNYVTSPHGSRIHPITGERETHLGIDIGAGAGTSVLASDSGTVISNSVHSS